ncbi:MAG: hypothetical protein ACAH59_01960 [Pseudobdellovibrionaceae bacterium]
MINLKLHSKLIALQGQLISQLEGEKILNQLRKILALKDGGQITIAEACMRIRKTAWRIAEDLRLNDMDLSCGSDQILMEKLPVLLKV